MLRKLFETKEGDIVIGQSPNPPIILAAVFTVLSVIDLGTFLNPKINFLSRGFLFIWAYQEVVQGVNLFRRLMGGLVLLFCIWWPVEL